MPPTPTIEEEKKPKIKKQKLLFYGLGLLLIVAIGSSIYFYTKYTKATADPSKVAAEELQDTIKLVERHMVLPTDEQPTLATVSDPEKLKDQAFFTKAQKGDKVLLYSNSKKAILYSVSQDKILEVAPFSANTTE